MDGRISAARSKIITNCYLIDAYVQSSDFDIGDGNNFGFIYRLIPDLTFDGSTVNTPTAYFTALPRTFPGAAYGPSNDPAVTSTQNYQNQRTYNVFG
mgnify:CR=1 FL=1